jgi:hypothetical protein
MSEEVLPIRFQKLGWHFEQVAREHDVAIYRRWKLYDGREGAVHYEVIRLVTQKARTTRMLSVQAKELYPSSNSWGSRGWTFKTLPEARAKYASLLAVVCARAAN